MRSATRTTIISAVLLMAAGAALGQQSNAPLGSRLDRKIHGND
jgi:hypothetical protein